MAADLDDTESLGRDSDDGACNDRGSQGGGESGNTDGAINIGWICFLMDCQIILIIRVNGGQRFLNH